MKILGACVVALLFATPMHAQEASTLDTIKAAVVSPPDEPRLLHALVAADVFLQFADVATTEYLIAARLGREGNGLMRWAVEHPLAVSAVKAGQVVLTIWAVDYLHKHHPRVAVIFVAAIDAMMTWVVYHNHALLPEGAR